MNISVEDLGGTPPGSRPRSLVLQHYSTIEGARARGWSWEQIGEAIGLTGDATRKAVVRVRRAIDAGRIDPEALARASAPARKASSRSAPAPSAPAREEQKPDAAWQGWKTLGKQESTQ